MRKLGLGILIAAVNVSAAYGATTIANSGTQQRAIGVSASVETPAPSSILGDLGALAPVEELASSLPVVGRLPVLGQGPLTGQLPVVGDLPAALPPWSRCSRA